MAGTSNVLLMEVYYRALSAGSTLCRDAAPIRIRPNPSGPIAEGSRRMLGGGDGRRGCASAPSVVIAFSSPGYFCLQSQSIKQVRGFLFFHSKYFLHPVSSLFTRRTGARSSKEAHGAVSSFLLTTGPVPAPTPAPALDPTPASAPTPAPRSPSWPRAIPAPSNTPQPQGQVWLEARGQHCTCACAHTHTHENPARTKTKKNHPRTRALEDAAARVIPNSAGLPSQRGDGGTGRGEPTAVY